MHVAKVRLNPVEALRTSKLRLSKWGQLFPLVRISTLNAHASKHRHGSARALKTSGVAAGIDYRRGRNVPITKTASGSYTPGRACYPTGCKRNYSAREILSVSGYGADANGTMVSLATSYKNRYCYDYGPKFEDLTHRTPVVR